MTIQGKRTTTLAAHTSSDGDTGKTISQQAYFDLLTATALGDSLGLAYENMDGKRVRAITKGNIRQRFVLGQRGMISDDTEHALITARALMDAGTDVDLFEHKLSSRLKRWLKTFPPGIGKATLTSILLMSFKSPSKCGRPSAGNGPLMRAPIIGLYHSQDQSVRDAFIKISTRMTHADPRATFMASGIADIVAHSIDRHLAWPFMSQLFRKAAERHAAPRDIAHVDELTKLLDLLDASHHHGHSVDIGLSLIGCGKGIDGYIVRSALGAAYIASHAQSLQNAIEQSVLAGGDTDSTAAIAAALWASEMPSGASSQLRGIFDWPVTPELLERHARGLALREVCQIEEPPFVRQFIRNLVFVALDMGHITRRLLPPYG
jgi:ADP-ribosylglycohydrolase